MARKKEKTRNTGASGTKNGAARAGGVGGLVAGIAAALIVFRFSNGGWPEIDWTHVVFIVAALFVIWKISDVIRNNLPTPEEYAQRKKKE